MIIEFKKYPNLRFTKELYEKEVLRKGEIIKKTYVLIMLKNLENGRSIVHPISCFLLKWQNCELNTILKRANEIIPFLNYILIDNYKIYELKELWDITFEHGEDYLNWLSEKTTRSTVKSAERTLTQFYFYLAKKNLFNNITLDDFQYTTKKNASGFKKEIIESPFDGVILPGNKKENRLHHFPSELVIPFINAALYKTPRIALGIYFQVFGGLRIGEIINITKSNVILKGPNGSNGMVLKIQKNNLRPDLNNNDGKGGVKRSRYQTVISCYGLLSKIYKLHINNYASSATDALFINKDGNALTERSYRADFEKLKEYFISLLEKSSDLKLRGYGVSLRQINWSSHIGRGIFSNLVASVANNAVEIALARGDLSLDSSLSYTSDAEILSKRVEANLNQMHLQSLSDNLDKNLVTSPIDLLISQKNIN